MSHPSIERLGPPPRDVPLLLSLQITFGGALNQAGWFFFGFGMIFFWVFFMNCELITWFTFSGAKATTQGVVTGCSKTNFSENHTHVHAIEYWYPAPDGTKQQSGPLTLPASADEIAKGYCGCSFARGTTMARGTPVTVEYLVSNPARSRVQGLRCKMVGAWVAFVAIFPLVGLCMLLPGYYLGRKARRLLERGNVGNATLKSKEGTGTIIGNRPVCKFIFEFQANGGQAHDVVTKTHITEDLEDEPQEKVLYDPLNADHAVLLDALPGSFIVDEQGMIQTANPVRALLVLLIPFATVVGHGAYLLLR